MYVALWLGDKRQEIAGAMAAFGSFAILLGLVLCVYNFVVGAFALRQIAVHPHASFGSERLAESARRAGIGSFLALSAAAFALVYCAFTNDFSRFLHPSPFQPGIAMAV